MSGLINREAAIAYSISGMTREIDGDKWIRVSEVRESIKTMPSAQPEIIRCKDCKYQDENWRRVSVRWLPCMDVRTGSNWYCGSAERGEQE